MRTVRLLKRLSLSVLLIGGLFLAGCGGGTVSPVASAASEAVTPASAPPTPAQVVLTGTPATSVTAGQTYMFQPTVSQGGVVTFSIQGQPNWATFNAKTGELTGSPAPVNEGPTGLIVITGTNGSSSASIGPFTIAVNAPSAPPPTTGSATLSWTEPTENTNGTPITGLAGYHIYYGTTENAWTTTITVTSPTQTSYVVTGLAPGTYYFAVVSFNTAGMDSPQSNIASKTI